MIVKLGPEQYKIKKTRKIENLDRGVIYFILVGMKGKTMDSNGSNNWGRESINIHH